MVTPCAFSHGCVSVGMLSDASFVETDAIFPPPATRASSDWPLATAIQPARKAATPLPLVYSTFIAEAGSNPSSLTRRFARPEMPSNSPLAMFPTNTSSKRTPSRPASSIAAREASASRPTTSLSLLPNFVVAQPTIARSEEHTSELQSQSNLVCRLLLEKKKNNQNLIDTAVTASG